MTSKDPIAVQVLQELTNTKYECSSLYLLAGGTANFTYRGTLTTLLNDGNRTPTVVVKHAEPYIAQYQSVELDVFRMFYEQTMLKSLHSLAKVERNGIQVTTPRLYEYSPKTHTSILEDYCQSLELKKYITTHDLSNEDVGRLGVALGSWLKNFHDWGAQPQLSALRETMKGNSKMAKLKFSINYGRTETTIAMFPGILEGSRSMFREMEKKYKMELEAGEGNLIHGDFWSGNILLHDGPLPAKSIPLELFVIDWELSHIGSLAFDLGQMFAELYLLTHFRSMPAGTGMISAIMMGYGELNDGMAFRVALHFGVHLIVWPPRVPGWGKGEIMERCVEFGRDCCTHAWNQDKEWFRGGVLDRVFSNSSD